METQASEAQRRATIEAMMQQQSGLCSTPTMQPALFSTDILDDIFTFHKWSPQQVERGNAIRAAAKALAVATLTEQEAVKAFVQAMRDSALAATPGLSSHAEKLHAVAQSRRHNAIGLASQLIDQPLVDKKIEFINKLVMEINSAITFEAATVERETTENAPVTQTGIEGDATV